MAQSLRSLIISVLDYIRHKKSYSQDGEDVVLYSFFGHKKGYKGFFVDVGAHHPVRFSNTWMLYRKGWRGINIDPTPGCMKPFNWLRPGDINLELGVGSTSGVLTFYCFNEPALNTFNKQVAEERNTGKPYRIVKSIDVPIKTLSQILQENLPQGQHIDFISIDVEGLDLDVLRSNDWSLFRPSYILVEDTRFHIKQVSQSEINNYLESIGYQIIAVLQRTLIYQLKKE
ncbi:MAG: FkbM family methyltransferase [Saprospiraceae bacterium]|nr:FkbM family methyltransferase [Saprospiraceae bacterium]